MKNTPLENCPFCGGEAKSFTRGIPVERLANCSNSKCEMSGYEHWMLDSAWNTRSPTPPHQPSDNCRNAFERWAEERGHRIHLKRKCGSYLDSFLNRDFDIWTTAWNHNQPLLDEMAGACDKVIKDLANVPYEVSPWSVDKLKAALARYNERMGK